MVRRFRFNALAMGAVMLALLCAGGLARATVSALAIDHKAVPSADHTVVTATGSLECTAGDMAVVTVTVLQGKSGTLGSATTTPPLACTGAAQAYTVDVPIIFPTGGEYRNGPATVHVFGLDVTDATSATVVANVVIAGANSH